MNKLNVFSPILQRKHFALLDGGLATELERKGHNLRHPLWSAKLLIENPAAIKEVHRVYLQAGADCITSASYQLSYPGGEELGLSRQEVSDLLNLSIAVTREVIDSFDHDHSTGTPSPILAASLGPYGAYLANGAEYSGRYEVSMNTLRKFHEYRWEVVAKSQPDLLAFETIPNVYEAETLRRLSEDFPDTAYWISFCCCNEKQISDGTPLQKVVGLFADLEQVVGIGINCTAPKFISKLIGEIKKGAPNKEVLVYPNSGEIYDKKNRCWIGEKNIVNFSDQAMDWYQAGAKILGGCCQTGPEHIAQIREKLSIELNR